MAEPIGGLDSDAELVCAAQAGCPDAFSTLFRLHYPSVRRACLRRLGNPVDADEAAQAAFVKALERIDQCDGQRRFGPWVHVIAQRLCVDTMRARARTQPKAVPVSIDRISTGPGNPEQSILDQERMRHLHEALSTLSERQREAVVARTLDDRGPGEIAADLGVSVGTVDSLLLRGRRRLARAYHRMAEERGAAAAGAISAATVAGGAAARPRRVASGVSAALSRVHHSALQLASTVGLLPPGRPAGPGVATAVLTAVLAVHTAAPAPADADRQAAAFANPAPAVITVRSPLAPLESDSVGASAVGGSLTALVGGLLDAARPPAADPVPADSPAGATASPAAVSGPETRSRATLADLAEAVLGPLSPASAAGPDRSQARGLADIVLAPADKGLGAASADPAPTTTTTPDAAARAMPPGTAPNDRAGPAEPDGTEPPASGAGSDPPATGGTTTGGATGTTVTDPAPAKPTGTGNGAVSAPAATSPPAGGATVPTTWNTPANTAAADVVHTVEDLRSDVTKLVP